MTKKKSIWSFVLAICLIVPAMFMLTACGHAHTFSKDWTKDATHHWHAATCEHTDEKDSYGEHTFSEWTEKTPAGLHHDQIEKRTCSECGFEETRHVANSALHDYEPIWKSDETGHWYACSCGKQFDFAKHTYGDWSEKTPAGVDQDRQLSRKCSECEYEDVLPFENTKTNGTYCMVVTDVFTVSGDKIIQVKILRGTINLGDNLSIDGINGTFIIEQIQASAGTTLLDSASYGQEVTLVLEEEDGNLDELSNLKRGSLMYEPNSVKSYKTFTAQIHLLEKDDANNVGRNTPIPNNSSFNAIIFNEVKDIKGTITFSNENDMIMSGETQIVTITLTSEVSLWEGMDFIIKEGSRKIVEGTILTVVNE